jgi:hypothetical protein
MLIYIGTPLTAVGLWKREDIDRVEASLYRKVLRIGNDIPNSAVLNIMTSTRLAGEVIHYLSREAQSEYRRQNRVTKYFDKMEKKDTVDSNVGQDNVDVEMRDNGGRKQYKTV